MTKLPQPQISFNYLGQFNQATPEAMPFAPAAEARGPDRSPNAARSHLVEIDGSIANGQLQMTWTYNESLHRRATISRVAGEFLASLRALIAHCQEPGSNGATPSDFPLANLDQKKLDKLFAKMNRSGDF
jgi:non-ribosomal peptide synthase protein (TIGR01720 family)